MRVSGLLIWKQWNVNGPGLKSLKVGYNKVFGYYIEITRSNSNLAPQEYIRKQTLVNAERYITPEMKEYETLVLNAEDRIRDIEGRLFRELCERLAGASRQMLSSARALAALDLLLSLAEAARVGWNREASRVSFARARPRHP